ncbi:metallophosphoesterase [Clostridium botulinum]|uniref:Phosphoesterase n=1 Tax=Clostridium botulinum TaxID=1491 RepID=A0A6G4EJ68_CLOBO|nr:metallophosphoesterase [Clostridium botulinum]APH17641.1 phosphodiesterase, family protein [Clostridium botulinum]AUM92776.1 YfcE family phosphodiesterase [Clostridium botulinum]NFB15409.1 metallophosphoesterase [Clostridium botulinum]NFH59303.1 metallophosphoesterase [Clostridium botulinum]NFH63287.1 metallophosphoesterase [Clostridium botulinum]
MKIGVISDTHRYIGDATSLVNSLGNVNLIIHLGDNVEDVKMLSSVYKGKIINVRGNCDFSKETPSELIENIGGKRFFITHGNRYDVKYSLAKLRYRALELEADIALFGHTHVSQIEYIDGIWFINPGSPTLPRNGVRSVAIIGIEGDKVVPIIKKI